MLSLFFVFRGGARFAAQVQRALEQVLGPRVDNYLTAIGQTVKAVIYGLGLSALVLGVLMGIGYWRRRRRRADLPRRAHDHARHHPLCRAAAVGRRRRCGSSSPVTPSRGWA